MVFFSARNKKLFQPASTSSRWGTELARTRPVPGTHAGLKMDCVYSEVGSPCVPCNTKLSTWKAFHWAVPGPLETSRGHYFTNHAVRGRMFALLQQSDQWLQGPEDTSLHLGSSKPTAGAAAFSGVWLPLLWALGICCAIGGQPPTEMRGYLLFLSSQNTAGRSGQCYRIATMPKTSHTSALA